MWDFNLFLGERRLQPEAHITQVEQFVVSGARGVFRDAEQPDWGSTTVLLEVVISWLHLHNLSPECQNFIVLITDGMKYSDACG